jgi:hypothetical protein
VKRLRTPKSPLPKDGTGATVPSPINALRSSSPLSLAADPEPEYINQMFELEDPNFPLLFLEVGTHEARMGVWNNVEESFELRFTCPSIVAFARNDMNRLDLVRGASTHSDPMYETFRETGVFVGTFPIK